MMKEKNPQKLDLFFLQPPSQPNKQISKALKLKKIQILIHTEETKTENTIVKSCSDKLKVYSIYKI